MKKFYETILALGCVCALFLGCAESPGGSCNILWTGGCLVLATAFALLFNWSRKQKAPDHE